MKSMESELLGFQDLKNMAGPLNSSKCNWLLYDELKNYKTINQLLDKGAAIILLQIEKRNSPKVGHWIILLDHKTHIEHFDSYGLSNDQETVITQEKHLSRLLQNQKFKNNTRRLQQFREDVNTCGRWVVARLLRRDVELNNFISFMDSFGKHLDNTVTGMTSILQFKQ